MMQKAYFMLKALFVLDICADHLILTYTNFFKKQKLI